MNMVSYSNFGLSEEEALKLIEEELDKNADLLIGIDDPEMQEMINVLKKAFVAVLIKNNEEIKEYIEKK